MKSRRCKTTPRKRPGWGYGLKSSRCTNTRAEGGIAMDILEVYRRMYDPDRTHQYLLPPPFIAFSIFSLSNHTRGVRAHAQLCYGLSLGHLRVHVKSPSTGQTKYRSGILRSKTVKIPHTIQVVLVLSISFSWKHRKTLGKHGVVLFS